MNIFIHREQKNDHGIPGELFINGNHECLTLENHLLAIPAGHYSVELVDSPHFGPDTPTINHVPDRSLIRIHGGHDEMDSKGCIMVGDRIHRETMTISGARFDHVLDRLKEKIKAAVDKGEAVWVDIKDAS